MTYIKWIAGALVAIIVLSFLHYTLPQRDIVHIVGTEVKRVDISDSWTRIFWASVDAGQSTNTPTRDVRFVNAELPNGDPYVCLLYTSPSPRDLSTSRMPSSA